MKHLFLMLVSASCLHTSAQLVTNDQITAEQLVEEIFQGSGVTISNVTINGLPGSSMMSSMGNYSYNGSLPVPPDGIILSSGDVLVGGWDPGSGYVNDADLLQLSNSSSINDVMLLEFDFIPEEDTMIFDYAFASGEYTTFTCTAFNDVFGFFLSGPGISGSFMNGAVNIAVVPGTETPIAINTVNSGIPGVNGDPYYCESMDPNWLSNSVYFQAITSEELLGFNGMTVTLQARYVVTPGASYHIKLAIGDAMDTVLDSGVFLKAASFRSVGGLPTAIEENTDNSLNAWFDESGRLWIDRKNGPVSAVTLHDIQGRLIARSSTNGQERVHIMLPEIPGGIYFVEAQFGDRQWHRTLIKAEQ